MIRAVFFDVGETLVDETRMWGDWADWLGVPRLTMFATLGAVIQRGEDHLRTFEILRPGIDVHAEVAARRAASRTWTVEPGDLYPDALPCLAALREQGLLVGIAGNSSADAEASLHALGLPVDVVGSAGSWGVEKPDPEFFRRLAAAAGFPPREIAYVGDRVDNDVVPAVDAGMTAVFLRRGPWALVQATHPGVARAAAVIDSLRDLPARLVQDPA